MAKHLIIPDQHAHFQHNNKRAEWLGHFINDIKPDTVINIGDAADMPSLASYDKGKKSFQGRTYKSDIDSHLDFQDRLWSVVKAQKKKLPKRFFFEGNHEYRIKRAINLQPELEGTISFSDLKLDYFYDEIIEYDGSTPGIKEIDGIHYAHYFVSGVMGRPISGEHPAYSLLTKQFSSCVAGHLHLLDFCQRTNVNGDKQQAVVVGVYQDYRSAWAGRANDLWWSGVVVLDNVDKGSFDIRTVDIATLKKNYG